MPTATKTPPAKPAPEAKPPDVPPWHLGETTLTGLTPRGERFSLHFDRAEVPPGTNCRADVVARLQKAKDEFMAGGEEWKRYDRLRKQLAEAKAALEASRREVGQGETAVREALTTGTDPAAAEAVLTRAAAQVMTLETRARCLEELLPPARAEAERCWNAVSVASRRKIELELQEEYLDLARQVGAAVPAELLHRFANASARRIIFASDRDMLYSVSVLR